MSGVQSLKEAVQRNCHISDALYGRQDTLCVYLMRMRDYFRWERGYGFGDSLPKEEQQARHAEKFIVGASPFERERLWESLEEAPLVELEVEGDRFQPFEAEAVNRALAPWNLVYSAGYGRHGKPSFFLGRLECREAVDGFQVHVSGEELARDLAAPPAMLQGESIFIRRPALAQLIWEKIEEGGGRENHPIRRAMDAYRFERDPDAALAAMTEREIAYVIAHELGEGLAGRRLGPRWEAMLAQIAGTRHEVVARAVRDNLADSLTTLPRLLQEEDLPSIHFYFANLAGMRKALNRRLAEAYGRFVESRDLTPIREAVEGSEGHWQRAAQRLLEIDAADQWSRLGSGSGELEGELARV